MRTGALIFMLLAWTFVLVLLTWSFAKLLRSPTDPDRLPPPGTSL